jgi:hypothetical protein
MGIQIDREALKSRCAGIGLTPSVVARFADLWPAQVCGWVRGDSPLSADSLDRVTAVVDAAEGIAETVGVPVRWSEIGTLKPLIAERICRNAQ